MTQETSKKYKRLIWVLSISIPLLVAVLFGVKIDLELPVFLPPIYAGINALTTVVLLAAYWAIRKKKIALHESLNKTALILSILFLALYVLYHMTSDSTKYEGEGILKTVYFVLLISHILLSITIIPLVLITYVRAILGNFESHKKIARITFPLWVYVALSGVLVYLMISPYY